MASMGMASSTLPFSLVRNGSEQPRPNPECVWWCVSKHLTAREACCSSPIRPDIVRPTRAWVITNGRLVNFFSSSLSLSLCFSAQISDQNKSPLKSRLRSVVMNCPSRRIQARLKAFEKDELYRTEKLTQTHTRESKDFIYLCRASLFIDFFA